MCNIHALSRVTIIALVACCAANAIAQYQFQDTIEIDGTRYIRHEVAASGADQWPVHYRIDANGDHAAVLQHDDFGLTLYEFSNWNNRAHGGVYLGDPLGSYHGCVVHHAATWTIWQEWDDDDTWARGRAFEQGEPITPEIDFSTPPYMHYFAKARNGRMASLFVELNCEASCHRDLYCRVFDVNGQPLSDLMVIGDLYYRSEHGRIDIAPDNSVVIAMLSDRNGTDQIDLWLKTLTPDFQPAAEYRVTREAGQTCNVRALDDGTIALHWIGEPPGSGAWVQRFSADLEPLTEPIAVDSGLYWCAFRGDGSFVLAGAIDLVIHARSYDANAQPTGERFHPIHYSAGQLSVGGLRPMVFTDDGTLWIASNPWWSPVIVTMLRPYEPGDMNFDGLVNNFDIDPFVLALTDPEEYQQLYPELPYQFLGDLNFDGDFNNFDIDPFVDALTAP